MITTQSQISSWGNSLAVRIPSKIIKESLLTEKQKVSISYQQGQIILTPDASPSLEKLCLQISPENCHKNIDTGESLGMEQW